MWKLKFGSFSRSCDKAKLEIYKLNANVLLIPVSNLDFECLVYTGVECKSKSYVLQLKLCARWVDLGSNKYE